MQKDLGLNKAMLPFGGKKTLLEYQSVRLGALFDNLFFSAKISNLQNCILDESTILGVDVSHLYAPMLGFYSALLRFKEAFFIAVDTPFFDEPQIKALLMAASINPDADVVVASSNGNIHPTIAIYRDSILDTLASHIAQNKLKLTLFLSTLTVIAVEFDESFTQNINDKKGYEEACLRI